MSEAKDLTHDRSAMNARYSLQQKGPLPRCGDLDDRTSRPASTRRRHQKTALMKISFLLRGLEIPLLSAAISREDAPFFMETIIDLQSDAYFMAEAMRMARKAYEVEEVPVGAVVVREGRIIGRACNQVELLKDATAHAEMLAITQAEAAAGDWRLTDCDLYVTKEPCPMCAGALVHVRMRRVIFGCADERAGAAGGVINLLQMPGLNHRCEITSGVLRDECSAILQDFFRKKRQVLPILEPGSSKVGDQSAPPI